MDRPVGQIGAAGGHATSTRRRLLHAAAELIAEVGWGRVTTRSIAERAGLPHGTVSYHFRGKQALLVEAALHTVEQGFPRGELEAVGTLSDLARLATAWAGDRDRENSVLPAVLLEAMRESTRDPVLREGIAAALRGYRRSVTGLVRAGLDRGAVATGVPPSVWATLFVAACDGLWLHALLDPELDVVGVTDALVTLMGRPGGGGRP